MKKTVFTLNVDDYAKEITDLTYPLIKQYAHKIRAEFQIISKRKFPEMPPVYEKLQIYELGKGNDWNIYIDSDALVHPDLMDLTEHLSKDTVLHHGADMASVRWTYDKYFRRDGRNIGSCNWFTVASDWCIDLWTPLDLTLHEAMANIHPTLNEIQCGIDASHLIDDYTLSRNIARFGLKFTTFLDLTQKIGERGNFLWHEYTIPVGEKVARIKEVLHNWKLIA